MIGNIECNPSLLVGELMIGPRNVGLPKRVISEQFMVTSSYSQVPVPHTLNHGLSRRGKSK